MMPKGKKVIRGNNVARFWSTTKIAPGGCVLWTGAKGRDGYGRFAVRINGRSKHYRAHRWIWEQAIGHLGSALLLHSCDTPTCVALQHLSPGNASQNAAEAVERGLHPCGVRNGQAKLTAESAQSIRALRLTGLTLAELAGMFGVSKTTIHYVLSGRIWKSA